MLKCRTYAPRPRSECLPFLLVMVSGLSCRGGFGLYIYMYSHFVVPRAVLVARLGQNEIFRYGTFKAPSVAEPGGYALGYLLELI